MKGSLAMVLPSNKEFDRLKTMTSTMATMPPDLNLENERSRLDSFRLVSTLSFFLVLDFMVEGAAVFKRVFISGIFHYTNPILRLQVSYSSLENDSKESDRLDT